MKRFRYFYLVVSTFVFLLFVMNEGLFADFEYKDMPDDWSTGALERLSQTSIFVGHNGYIMPNKFLTRAEYLTAINRAFKTKQSFESLHFSDVKDGDWFYNEFNRGISVGFLTVDSEKAMPENFITREEVMVNIARLLNIKSGGTEIVRRYRDSHLLSDSSKEYIEGLVKNSYVIGDSNNLRPTEYMTRAEFAVLMDRVFGNYINFDSDKDLHYKGNLVINTGGIKVSNIKVSGDLIISDGVSTEELVLENVTVNGRIVIRAGLNHALSIKGESSINKVLAMNKFAGVSINNFSEKSIKEMDVSGNDVKILGRLASLNVSAGVENCIVNGKNVLSGVALNIEDNSIPLFEQFDNKKDNEKDLKANEKTESEKLVFSQDKINSVDEGVENSKDTHSNKVNDKTSKVIANNDNENYETPNVSDVILDLDNSVQDIPQGETISRLSFDENMTKVNKPVAQKISSEDITEYKVSLSTETEGAEIYYTTNGNIPDSSSLKYNEPISLSEDMVLNVIAIKQGMLDSDVLYYEYNLSEIN